MTIDLVDEGTCAKLRKAETGERVGRALALETTDVVTSLAFSPDGVSSPRAVKIAPERLRSA